MKLQSRQQCRRETWLACFRKVTEENLTPVMSGQKFTGQYRGMSRRERRKLAKAYFAKECRGC